MFLMIRNNGIVDSRSITLLGVSGTRNAQKNGTIGSFGSGAKHSIALFLRHRINPVICSGNLKMEFYSKPINIRGEQFNQAMVKFSGRDEDGNFRTSNEDLGFTLEWGIADWKKLGMGLREFVANAIDGAVLTGGSYKDVEIDVKDSPRAKAGHTAVFLPLTQEVQQIWSQIGTLFLHFSKPELLKEKVIPNQSSGDYVLVYKNGVLVCQEEGDAVFSYNLGSELTLDESRNASSWDIRYAVAKALGSARSGQIATVLNAQIGGRDVWESKLDFNYLYNIYENDETRAKKTEVFKAAFQTVAGDSGILTQGSKHINEIVERKGFKPIKVSPSWYNTLEKYGVPTENQVLEGLEKEGIPESPATDYMYEALDKVWNLIDGLDMLNGKSKPQLKAFTPVMNAESQTFGMYKNGVVYIHTDYGNSNSPGLLKVMLEEVVHHITGATDMSRDFQDYLIRLIVRLHWQQI